MSGTNEDNHNINTEKDTQNLYKSQLLYNGQVKKEVFE